MKFQRFVIYICCINLLFSCSQQQQATDQSAPLLPATPQLVKPGVALPLHEDFESGSKKVYNKGTVTLASGYWTLDDALIAATNADTRTGRQSVRIRKNGKLQMNFDVLDGASTVTIQHALYGNDGGSEWQLWISADGGTNYTQVDSTVNTNSQSFQTAAFKVNKPGRLRFELRKTSGGNNRINIDDFTIRSYADSAAINNPTANIAADNSNLLLGNPSGAKDSIASADNYLIDQVYYTESYNARQGKPNWVSWYLGSSTLGNAARKNNFRPDAALPTGFYTVTEDSYNGSGFDRGHNCPSGDRTGSRAANSATFLMTNMMPQAPNNNQHTWADLEVYERELVRAGYELYVICGSYGAGGSGYKGFATTIDKGRITVPSNTWKIIVVLPDGDNDLARIDNQTRVIAVNMPNSNSIDPDWRSYLTSVDAIESATGYDFLSNLPPSVQLVIEARLDISI